MKEDGKQNISLIFWVKKDREGDKPWETLDSGKQGCGRGGGWGMGQLGDRH